MPRPAMLGGALAVLLTALPATAQFPSKPITLVVPYGAGSTTDVLARLIGEKAAQTLGQAIIIENRPGAGGVIGTEAVAHADADGYTLVFAANQTHATNVSLYPDLPYDPVADFSPIARLVMQPQVLVIHPSVQADTATELKALASVKADELAFASTGLGTGAHLSGELFALFAETPITHVPYNGSEAITALLAGTVDFMFYPYLPLKGHIDSNALKLLASTSPERVAWLPNTPTMIESNFDDFVMSSWFAVYGPDGIPPDTVSTLSSAFLSALEDPEIAEQLAQGGSIAIPGGPDELAEFTNTEISRAATIVTRSGVTID
ncbi:tripartite tricarboxylate transporter substrate binding protein [Devosia sp. MC532]|uniref:Bug family tripartite tricarboxylate transporter substrate binding protein n=1 Tax=Devosia sp. MC532 TaxID=2799788 RepID=UPI0018F7C2EA|nr:tripartite tricarboxylate transporter substrate-binding protein [Devosia sp. MC532]MBJ7578234.1 tripartite tricarboxylate transporter substrate binding protein [Devosia sp. MC532]